MSSSTESRPLCNVCNHQYAIYTCPRCTARTCSLPCSSAHKSSTGCSGERNKAAYVPMNQYGWGTMMDDYTFLEGVGRKVGDWGREIARGGFGNGRPTLRGRARGGRGGGGHPTTKRDVLKVQLDMRDIEVELLPVGMERRKMNESSWDFKNKTAFLTIQFKFHPPFASSSYPPDSPFILITHRNNINQTLLSLIQGHVRERAKSKSPCPGWVKSFVLPNSDEPDSFVTPQCVMPAQINSLLINSGSRSNGTYYAFDPLIPLVILLHKTQFVEFPTIEVWEEFKGTVVNTDGTIIRREEGRQPKRRKLTSKASKIAMNGLLGGYGSEDEDKVDTRNVLSILGDYAGSDENVDEESPGEGRDEDYGDADADGVTDEEMDVELDPAALLELVRQIQDGKQWIGGANDDKVDWGDSDDDGADE